MKRLVAQYQQALLKFFARRSQNMWDAEELTQEVFCKILKSNNVYYRDYTDAYIYTIAKSVLLDRSRREKARHRDMHVAYDDLLIRADTISPEKTLTGDELYRRFLDALNELSPKVRTVFILSRFEGRSYTQIAKHCGIGVSAVEKHMMKALKRMNEIVKKR